MAFGLPASTEFNKKIPKQKFYDNMPINTALKRCFIDKISAIYWRNKISRSTVNLAAGKTVLEIEIIGIVLTDKDFDPKPILQIIDRLLPYHILFILEYKDKRQAWGSYKQPTESGKNAFIVDAYYHTPWVAESDLTLKIEGLNLDSVYENFIRQIAGQTLATRKNEPLKLSVERDRERKKLEKQIAALENKRKAEVQFNKQVEINKQVKELKDKLNKLLAGE